MQAVSATEAERRFGGKWSEAEREMFGRLTAPANVEKTVASIRRQLGGRPETEIYSALREIEMDGGLSPVDELLGLGLYAIFPAYTEGTHIVVRSPLSPALLMGEKKKIRGGDLPGGVRLTSSRMRDYVYHWRLTPTFEPVCLDEKAKGKTAVVAAAIAIVEAAQAAERGGNITAVAGVGGRGAAEGWSKVDRWIFSLLMTDEKLRPILKADPDFDGLREAVR
jgi:hypothetical protein